MQIETRHFLLCALALAHLSLGTTAVLLSRHLQENWQMFLFFVVIISQAGLLSVLVGLGTLRIAVRSGWLVFGCTYLALLTDTFLPASVPVIGRAMYIGFAVTPLFVVSVLLTVARKRYGQITFIGANADHDRKSGFRFSIQHFLLLNVFLALLMAVRPSTFEPTITNSILLGAIMALCAAALILGTVWGSLSPGRAWPRLAVVLLLAFLAGLFPAYYVQASAPNQLTYVFSIGVSLTQASIIIASLLVARFAGYRIVMDDLE